MNLAKLVSLSIALLLIQACSHPIEIEGQGDVTSQSGNRNCSLEQFTAADPVCSENLAIGAYQETYNPSPRAGWKFDRWVNYCTTATGPNYDCPFNVSAATVQQFWGQTMPPLRAVFTPQDGTPSLLWGWGRNSLGGIGDGTTTERLTPVEILPNTKWTDISAGGSYSCAVLPERIDDYTYSTFGTLWCWGSNTQGQLGIGSPTTTSSTYPTQVGTAMWGAVDAGSAHTCAIRSDRTLWCWGSNEYEQLGDPDASARRFAPVQIGSATWKSVTAGRDHTCGIQTDDSLWCWGRNNAGQLGDGLPGREVPTRVGTALWKSVSLGDLYTCAVRSDDTLWCWGSNAQGQLGDGTYTNRFTPQQVGTSAWAAVSAGSTHTCGIASDKALWCWGSNVYGQVGDGTSTSFHQLPVKVGTASWNVVDGRSGFTCAVRSDLTLWCWGRNDFGQLGDSTKTDRLAPVRVGTESNWVVVSAGGGHVHALQWVN